MADNVYIGDQRGTKFKADVVDGVAILAVKLVGGADNTDGGYITTNDGKLMVVDAGYLNQIREGNIPNHTYFRLEGNNPSVSTALEEISDLGTVGFGNWSAVSSPIGVILTGDSADDDAGGDGALTVTIRGLDAAGALAEAVVATAGVGAMSITGQTFSRIHELEVATAGSDLTNAGTITASMAGVNIISLQPGHSKSFSGRYTVPANMTLYLENPTASVIGIKNCTFHLFTRDTQTANSPFVLRKIFQAEDGPNNSNQKLFPIPALYDVIMLGQAGATTTITEFSLEGWLES